MRVVTDKLTADIGGDPSAGQQLLIGNAAVMATRLALLQDKLLNGDPGEGDQHHCLAWLNSLTRTVVALGLKRQAKEIIHDGSGRLADHFSRPYVEAAE